MFPVQIKTIKGEPVTIGDKQLTPLVRVISLVKRHGTVSGSAVWGNGFSFVRLTPIAVLEKTASGQRRISIRDRTQNVLVVFLLMAIIMPFFWTLVARMVKKLS